MPLHGAQLWCLMYLFDADESKSSHSVSANRLTPQVDPNPYIHHYLSGFIRPTLGAWASSRNRQKAGKRQHPRLLQ